MTPSLLYLHWGQVQKTVVIGGLGVGRGKFRNVLGSGCRMDDVTDLIPRFNEEKNLVFMAVFEDKH